MSETKVRPFPKTDLDHLIAAAHATRPGFISTIVDGGAGIGDTIQPLLDADPGLSVVAYEPLPENVGILKSRFLDEPRVTIKAAALSDANGTATFCIPSRMESEAGRWAPGTSYNGFLAATGWKSTGKAVVKRILKRQSAPAVITVPTVRLDQDLSYTPDVVKLDLQGAEPAAIGGLGNLLPDVKVVQAEVQLLSGSARHYCVEALEAGGFDIYLGDLQFGLPEFSPDLRAELAEFGVVPRKEITGSAFDEHTLVLGTWNLEFEAPFIGSDLDPGLAQVLNRARADYFQVDLIALNRRHMDEWEAILGTDASSA